MSKNTRTRILLTAVAALLLVTMAVGGTLAWLTDVTDPVNNEFTPTNLDIELDEDEEEFIMVPNKTIEKNPYVTINVNSEACYVFVKIDKANNLDNYISYDVITEANDTNDEYAYHWTKVDGITDEVYYIQVSADDAKTGKTYDVLMNGEVTVKADVTNAMMAIAETNKPTLTFTAYAIQSSYLPEGTDTITEIWDMAKAQAVEYPAGT